MSKKAPQWIERFQQFPTLTVFLGKEEKKEQNVTSSCNSTELGGRLLSSLSSKSRVQQIWLQYSCGCRKWGVTQRINVPAPPFLLSGTHFTTFYQEGNPKLQPQSQEQVPLCTNPITLVAISESVSRICIVHNFPRFPLGDALPT